MSAAARARLAVRTNADYASGGHRTVFVPDLNDAAAVGNEVANTAASVEANLGAAQAVKADVDAKALEVQTNTSQALQSKQQAEAAVAGVTVGSTNSLAYPEVVRNLATASDVVDVFVYDTRLDSDGGAWTERCSGTSWFNEALSTATRGAKRSFPKTALAVLRSGTTATLTIYDALALDGGGVPNMWRVIARTAAGILDGTPVSVSAQNGRLWVTTSAGLYMLDFATDRAVRWDASGRSTWASGLTDAGAYAGNVAAGAIVSATCTHVHARVLPGAPLNPVSGLPIPTVAVSTPAGVSVLHPDGRVASITVVGGYVSAHIRDDGLLLSRFASAANIEVGPIPYAATATNSAWRSAFYSSSAAPAPLASLSRGALALPGGVAARTTSGLSLFAEDRGNLANGMAAYVTNNFATGWQPGNIRLATLCDGAVGAITGSGELIVNGTFATGDLTGWVNASVGTGTVTVIAEQAVFEGSAGNNADLRQSFATVVGQTYRLTLQITGTDTAIRIGTTSGGAGNGAFTALAGATSVFSFVATASTTWLQVVRGGSCVLDNVSVKLSIADRSFRGNDLEIVGTLTRAAVNTGNDIAAWSGFAGGNYLEQPYNANLDFGTDDFCIAMWVTVPDPAASKTVVSRGGGATAPFAIITASSVWRLVTTDSGGSTSHSGTSAPKPGFQQVIALRRAGVAELWVDGALEVSASNTRDLTEAAALLRVGVSAALGTAWDGSVAMLRIAAYAPTPAQIARMYADERPLFDMGAKAFLGGTSNSIAGMSFSDTTRRLAVATANGVSVFAGLRRVEYLDSTNTALAIANNTMRAVSMEGGVAAFGTSANAGVRRDAITGLDRLPAGPVGLHRVRMMRASGVTVDATPLSLSPRVPVGERETVVVEATVVGRVYGTDTERLSYVRRSTYYRPAGGNVTLQGSVQTIGTDTEVTAGADATLAIDTTAQTVTPQVTGVAATRIVWSATLRITRVSEQTQYEGTV